MKRLLLSMLFFTLCMGARAQVGALKIINNNPDCSIFVNMHAKDNFSTNYTGCDLIAPTQILGPAPFADIYANPAAFFPTPGFSYEAVPEPVSYWSGVTTFAWEDIDFQYQCPECSGGGRMSEPGSSFSCYGALPVWTGPCGHYATWSSSTPGVDMSNVVITFN